MSSNMDVLRAPIQALGMALFRAVRKVRPTGNALFSPLTASNGFLLIYLGSDGLTRVELIRALHIEHWCGSEQKQVDLEMAFRYILAALTKSRAARQQLSYDDPTDGRFRVFRINKIFLDETIVILPEYAERIAKLRSEAVLMPFSTRPEEARRLINRYFRDSMNGRVREAFPPEAITNQTQIVLANGFCFRARWEEPFDPADTTEGIFKSDDGQTFKAQYMRRIFSAAFVEATEMNMLYLEIPYMRNDASLLIFMPTGKGPLKDMAKQLNPSVIRDFHQVKRSRLIDLMLPKFAVRSNLDLIVLFKMLGVKSLFNNKANLSRMMADTNGVPVALSAARQCGFFNVSENGTDADESVREPEGSASNNLDVPVQRTRTSSFTEESVNELSKNLKQRLQLKSSIPGAFRTDTGSTVQPFPVTVNRPFIFGVRHNKSGIILCFAKLEQL